MDFIVYDVSFLAIFVLFVSWFLYSHKKNLNREGLLFLYKAGWGIKLINKIGGKYKKTLKVLSYASIATGYLLMIAMFYLLGRMVYIYAAFPSVVKAIKIPPITPLVPYLPQVFNLTFLPPFYFTYWIIIIAIIAIFHEFSHGIFAAYNKIKIKSTGFGFFPFFLPVFLAAFVELDEKKMAKKKIGSQLAILSAGTFANVITAILFFGFLWIFFSLSFTASGVTFDTYPYNYVSVSNITSVNGIQVNNPNYDGILSMMNDTQFNKIKSSADYVISKSSFAEQRGKAEIMAYYDSPAIEAQIESTILKIDGKTITSIGSMEEELSKRNPGDKITLTLIGKDGSDYNRDVVLGENPQNKSKAWLGVGFFQQQNGGIINKIYSALSSFKKPNVYYQPRFDGIIVFIYHLLWWISLISISVALVNMLPVGIFDGGRFFYLTVFAITKSESKAKKFFAFSTYFILFLVFLMMAFWIFSLI